MSPDSYAQYEDIGGRCRLCGKRYEICRCEERLGPKPREEKNYTLRYYDLGLRRTVYSGFMTWRAAQSMSCDLLKARRRVAQYPTVLRRLRVIQHICRDGSLGYQPEPTFKPFDRWEK
jgi:hypothetical protein